MVIEMHGTSRLGVANVPRSKEFTRSYGGAWYACHVRLKEMPLLKEERAQRYLLVEHRRSSNVTLDMSDVTDALHYKLSGPVAGTHS